MSKRNRIATPAHCALIGAFLLLLLFFFLGRPDDVLKRVFGACTDDAAGPGGGGGGGGAAEVFCQQEVCDEELRVDRAVRRNVPSVVLHEVR